MSSLKHSATQQILLDATDNLALGDRERPTTFSRDLHRVIHQVTARKVDTDDRMREREALVDGDSVRDTAARAKDNARCTIRRVHGQNGRERDIARVLIVSNTICVIFSRFAFRFVSASVGRTGCSSGATRGSLKTRGARCSR